MLCETATLTVSFRIEQSNYNISNNFCFKQFISNALVHFTI